MAIKYFLFSEKIEIQGNQFNKEKIKTSLNALVNTDPVVEGDEHGLPNQQDQPTFMKSIYKNYLSFLITTRLFRKKHHDTA